MGLWWGADCNTALMNAVGNDGTLVMPAHSGEWSTLHMYTVFLRAFGV